jgi:hypothetical protein
MFNTFDKFDIKIQDDPKCIRCGERFTFRQLPLALGPLRIESVCPRCEKDVVVVVTTRMSLSTEHITPTVTFHVDFEVLAS